MSTKVSRYKTLSAPPAGLVAVYVFAGEFVIEPIVAFAIQESWRSTDLEADEHFDPEVHHGLETEVVPLVMSDGNYVEVLAESHNLHGVFLRDEITDELRRELIEVQAIRDQRVQAAREAAAKE